MVIKKPFTMFVYGLPCSGKTTLSKLICKRLSPLVHIDGDDIRTYLCSDLGFTDQDRVANHHRVANVCRLLLKNNISSIVSIILPFEETREENHMLFKNSYIQIKLDCSIDKCIKRDVKGMYKKALNGEIKNFTGIDGRFDYKSKFDNIIVDSETFGEKKCYKIIWSYLKSCEYI